MNAGHLSLADLKAATQATAKAQPSSVDSERAAFDQLITDHQPQITRLVRRLMAWPDQQAAIDDVVQEVFLAAWAKRDQFRGDATAATWLSRIAINKTRNDARQRATWRRVVEGFAALVRSQSSTAPSQQEPITDEQAKLRAGIHRLKQTDREIIVLRYLEEQSPDEIAAMIGIKRNTVDARLSRARQRLKVILQSDTIA